MSSSTPSSSTVPAALGPSIPTTSTSTSTSVSKSATEAGPSTIRPIVEDQHHPLEANTTRDEGGGQGEEEGIRSSNINNNEAQEDSMVIGSQRNSTDGKSKDGIGAGISTPPIPKCHLRALVISGQSHVFSFEPEITVGRMKEIIWSSWPTEWTEPSAPPSPAFLRVLYSGRILQDDSTLSSNNLPTAPTSSLPTVVHISVRSFSLKGDEGDPKKGFLHPTTSRTSRRNEEVGGCKCVIM